MNGSHTIIEEIITDYPVLEFAHISVEELIFSDKARFICTTECNHYNCSWGCPPAIAPLDECIALCRSYENAFLFSTVSEIPYGIGFDEHLAARRQHEEITLSVKSRLESRYGGVLALSAGCVQCEECTYPDSPCRHPDKRLSTIESHGIMIMQMAAERGMNFDCGENLVVYFSLLLYNE